MNSFFDSVPTFVNGVHSMHDTLAGVAFVMVVAGLVYHSIMGMLGRSAAPMFGTLVRCALVPIFIVFLQGWGEQIIDAVNELANTVGANTSGSTVFQDYQMAIARRLGTAAAAQNVIESTSPNGVTTQGPSGYPANANSVALSGVTLSDYGYPGDSTPDSKSSKGIGAFPFDSAKGSLIADYSAGLSPDVAAQYNLSPGQQFTVTTSSGRVLTLQYADKTGNDPNTGLPLTNRIDIYDPSGQLGGNNFSASVATINSGAILQGQNNPSQLLANPGGFNIGDNLLWAVTLLLLWIGEGLMWIMTIVQGILYLIEMAVSPIFIACLMIPALTFLARKFFLTLIGILLWPLSWSICNLVTVFLIGLAVNPGSGSGLQVANAISALTGPLTGAAYLLILAVWVIGSTLAAPLFIAILLGSTGGATAAVFGATVGTVASAASRTAVSAAGDPAGIAAGSIQAATYMADGIRPNFARRPMNEPEQKS